MDLVKFKLVKEEKKKEKVSYGLNVNYGVGGDVATTIPS